MSGSRSEPFACVRARAVPDLAERVAAEAWAAGASGLEERDEGTGVSLLLYAPAARAPAVRAAAVALLGEAAVSAAEEVPEADWPERWKQGLRPIVVSPRLVVRPPFVRCVLAPGQREVVIEPRQAFGTGAHASTALALEALDAAVGPRAAETLLDVGCGSGVLALAALRLGVKRALAFDVDSAAAREALDNARRNGLGDRLAVFAGPLEALGARAFELVVANLLRSELAPLLPELAARLRPGGLLVVSGLLAAEQGWAERAIAALGARVVRTALRRDEGGDEWLALTASR